MTGPIICIITIISITTIKFHVHSKGPASGYETGGQNTDIPKQSSSLSSEILQQRIKQPTKFPFKVFPPHLTQLNK